jgi:integrase
MFIAFDLARIDSGVSRRGTEGKLFLGTVKDIQTARSTILGRAEFWDYMENNPVRKTRRPRRGLQPGSVVWLLVLRGLRIGELLALRGQDIDVYLDRRRVFLSR